MTDKEIAETILRQMGGQRRLKAMINARNFLYGGGSVTFTFSLCKKANRCRITLNKAMDLYTMELFKVRGVKCDLVYELDGMDWEMLQPVFSSQTGLALSL